MRRRSTVLDFRRPKPRRWAAPEPVRRKMLALAQRRSWGVCRVLRWSVLVPVLLLAGMYWGEQVSQQDETLRFAVSAPAQVEPRVLERAFKEPYTDEPLLPGAAPSPNEKPERRRRSAVSAKSAKVNELVEVAWVDGDSGRISGRRFRLYGIDAPEGSHSRAECARERTRAQAAAAAAKAMTAGGGVRVSEFHGIDVYGREVVSLSAQGRDVATALIRSGHAKHWDYDGGELKPDWCN